MPIQFDLSAKEEEAFNFWRGKHKQECILYAEGILRTETFMFTPTGIGSCVEVECSCGDKINVTDYGSW